MYSLRKQNANIKQISEEHMSLRWGYEYMYLYEYVTKYEVRIYGCNMEMREYNIQI